MARRAKVSTATVSRVLNGSSKVRESTAERVKRVIEELNYVPNNSARSLRIGRSELFGLVVSDIKNPFFPDLIDQFEGLATVEGFDVLFSDTKYDGARASACVRRLVERNVDGIAVMTTEADEPSLDFARRRRIPVVLLNQPNLRDRYTSIPIDYTRCYLTAVRHLTGLGHRDVAFLAGRPAFSSISRRQKAFESAARKCGLELRPECIISGEMSAEGGRAAMKTLLSLKRRPTALMATNDLMAVGVLQAVQEAGLRVPDDISVVGFDDLPICEMVHPQLTTIHLSRDQIAAAAFSLLMQLVKLKSVAPLDGSHKIYPELLVRGSTASPRKGSRRKQPASR